MVADYGVSFEKLSVVLKKLIQISDIFKKNPFGNLFGEFEPIKPHLNTPMPPNEFNNQ